MITRDEAQQVAAEAACPPDARDGWALAEFSAGWLDRPGNRGGTLLVVERVSGRVMLHLLVAGDLGLLAEAPPARLPFTPADGRDSVSMSMCSALWSRPPFPAAGEAAGQDLGQGSRRDRNAIQARQPAKAVRHDAYLPEQRPLSA
jgi:hypothetical protein